MVTLPKLLARVAALSPEQKQLLAQRQVTEAQLARAAGLIAKVQESSDQPVEPVDPTIVANALAEAETRMWRHYLEWSQIIRAQVKRPRYLQLMGFGTGSRKAPEVELTLGQPTNDDANDENDVA